MTEIKLIRDDDKATKILAAVAQIDAGVELAPVVRCKGCKDVSNYRHAIKPKADRTLLGMKKAELIEYIRTLEHNYNVAAEFNENQARSIERLLCDSEDVTFCSDSKCQWERCRRHPIHDPRSSETA